LARAAPAPPSRDQPPGEDEPYDGPVISRRTIRTALAATLALALGAGVLLSGPPARAVAPTFWPSGQSESATAYSLRFSGTTRIETAGAAALFTALGRETTTGFPFNEGDPTTPAKAYGMAACPSTIVVVATDGLPDAIASASMRGLPSVTIPGTRHTFNTANALLLLTGSARAGATSLSGGTARAIASLRSHCQPFDAIILGGTDAVPPGAGPDLAADTGGTVGRLAGTDRFDTARLIAFAVTGGLAPPAVNYWSSASASATSEPATVFLADAVTGADALALGPVAADQNVPVLLATAAGLPEATKNALSSLHPQTIIVAGGTAVLPDSVVTDSKTAAGGSPTAIRISGPTRADTSVSIAENLDDVWTANAKSSNPFAGTPTTFSDQVYGLAVSNGTGGQHAGWPDALASAYVLDTIYKNGRDPKRLAPPAEQNNGKVFIAGAAMPFRPPLLLTAGSALDAPVDAFLAGLYPNATHDATNSSKNDGGFVFAFGGTVTLDAATELKAATDVSGGDYKTANQSDIVPTIDGTKFFYSAADYTKYQQQTTSSSSNIAGSDGGLAKGSALAAGDKICAFHKGLVGAQWLDLFSSPALVPNSVPHALGQNAFFCVSATSMPNQTAGNIGFSLSGNATSVVTKSWGDPAMRLTTTAPGASSTPTAHSETGDIDAAAANPFGFSNNSSQRLTYQLNWPVSYKDQPLAGPATLKITLTRTGDTDNGTDLITCTGNVTENASSGVPAFTANLTGESATVPDDTAFFGDGGTQINCVGVYTVPGPATGGFRFIITGSGGSAALSDLVLDGNA